MERSCLPWLEWPVSVGECTEEERTREDLVTVLETQCPSFRDQTLNVQTEAGRSREDLTATELAVLRAWGTAPGQATCSATKQDMIHLVPVAGKTLGSSHVWK